MKTVRDGHQCIECRYIRPADRLYHECPSCGARVLYEALDQYYYSCDEVCMDRLSTLANNLARVGYMEWARQKGRREMRLTPTGRPL